MSRSQTRARHSTDEWKETASAGFAGPFAEVPSHRASAENRARRTAHREAIADVASAIPSQAGTASPPLSTAIRSAIAGAPLTAAPPRRHGGRQERDDQTILQKTPAPSRPADPPMDESRRGHKTSRCAKRFRYPSESVRRGIQTMLSSRRRSVRSGRATRLRARRSSPDSAPALNRSASKFH